MNDSLNISTASNQFSFLKLCHAFDFQHKYIQMETICHCEFDENTFRWILQMFEEPVNVY